MPTSRKLMALETMRPFWDGRYELREDIAVVGKDGLEKRYWYRLFVIYDVIDDAEKMTSFRNEAGAAIREMLNDDDLSDADEIVIPMDEEEMIESAYVCI